MWDKTQQHSEQHSRTDYNNFPVYQSYLLQLYQVCFALAMTELANLKLHTSEGGKRRRISEKESVEGERERKIQTLTGDRARERYSDGARYQGGKRVGQCTQKTRGMPMKRRPSPGCMPHSWLLSPSAAYCTSVVPSGRKQTIFHPPIVLMM